MGPVRDVARGLRPRDQRGTRDGRSRPDSPGALVTPLATAIAKLSAVDHDGDYAYYEEGTHQWYQVTEGDMIDLGERLVRGDRDAYSLWCAETAAEEIAEPNTDDGPSEALRALAPSPADRRASLLGGLASYDDGTGTLGIIVDQALADDPLVTLEAVREIVVEAIEDAKLEASRQ